jgi:hypothetical protein
MKIAPTPQVTIKDRIFSNHPLSLPFFCKRSTAVEGNEHKKAHFTSVIVKCAGTLSDVTGLLLLCYVFDSHIRGLPHF